VEPAVLYDVADRVVTLTLNRPDRLNAWTGRMEDEYRAAIAAANDDPDVRVIVVTGAGRGFCAGADSKALGKIADTGEYDSGRRAESPTAALSEPGFAFQLALDKPVIAAINGPAAGVGFVLACFCDLRFAAAGAKLTTSFGRLGLPAEYGTSWLLPRILGVARAADLLFTSRVVLAEEAAAIGLVNDVMPPDELLPRTQEIAQTIASEIAPSSLREMKRQLYADLLSDLDTSVARSVELMHRMVGEPDFVEGAAALSEKRPPRFP